jgi:hypothetical protein
MTFTLTKIGVNFSVPEAVLILGKFYELPDGIESKSRHPDLCTA